MSKARRRALTERLARLADCEPEDRGIRAAVDLHLMCENAEADGMHAWGERESDAYCLIVRRLITALHELGTGDGILPDDGHSMLAHYVKRKTGASIAATDAELAAAAQFQRMEEEHWAAYAAAQEAEAERMAERHLREGAIYA